VHIEIPIDVIAAPAGELPVAAMTLPARPAADPQAIAAAAALLNVARRPFVVLGGGAADAAEEARALVEALDAPAFCTINGKGLLPPGHPLGLCGNLGMAPVREALADADAVLVVGSELGETEMYPDPQPLHAGGPVVRIDIDPEQLVRALPAEVPITADARLALRALNGALEPRRGDGAARAQKIREAVRATFWPAVAVHERIMAIVAETLPAVIVAGDSAEPVYAANQVFEPSRPRSFFNSSTGYGTLGYGLPAAIGAKLAAPDRPVVCLVGDGGLQFSLPELAAAVEAAAPVIVLLWNNSGYGEIKAYMRDRGIPEIGVDIHTPDFVALAKGFGCLAARLDGVEKLADALRAAQIEAAPSLIELRPAA
jgi:acetolactate synthase-1/2/3 large subunit